MAFCFPLWEVRARVQAAIARATGCDRSIGSRILIRAANHPPTRRPHMKLNHLNLTVSNVLETHRFLQKHFGLKDYGPLAPSEAMSFLSDDNGLVLALFRGKDGKVSYPPGFHVGFVQKSEAQ